jgi:hypothetical protein
MEAATICNEQIFDIHEMKKKIDGTKLAELAGYFQKAGITLNQNDTRFPNCKTVLALVFQSGLNMDLGYDNMCSSAFVPFKTATWTDATGHASTKLKAVVKPWHDANKLNKLTVWDLDEICRKLSQSYTVWSTGEHLLFNCRANILAALKANYGASAVKLVTGVLGHNAPVLMD